MKANLLLVTPPFTQLNTAYPATAYIKGFLEHKDVSVSQMDLSIELFTKVFTSDFLRLVFQEAIDLDSYQFPEIQENKKAYISKVDIVIAFLQKQNIETAHKILTPNFLPIGHRLKHVSSEIVWEKGDAGVIDKAKHFATLFVEELGDFIHANVDEFFSFTKYAEQIATSASSFDQLEEFLNYQPTLIEDEMLNLLEEKIKKKRPIWFVFPFHFQEIYLQLFDVHSS